MEEKVIEFRAMRTPEGIWVDYDIKTGKPTRLVLDGVEFTPSKVPERESWNGWPRLERNSGPLRMEFAK